MQNILENISPLRKKKKKSFYQFFRYCVKLLISVQVIARHTPSVTTEELV